MPNTPHAGATLTIDQIEISPLNVRTYQLGADDTIQLEASIAEHGLRDALHVHPLKGRKGKWGAIDGQRRYRSIKALVARGVIAADWPVPVVHHDALSDAELIELSISENLLRKDLRFHELFAGAARAVAKGHDVETVAKALGQQDRKSVAGWVRLGRLPKPIFHALLVDVDPDQVRLDEAKAYAATEDADLQLAVFQRLSAGPSYHHTPQAIRAALKVGDREEAKLLTFVGEGIYRAGGGSYELDLFADTAFDRGRVTDAALLQRLVEEKLATIRDQVRATTGQPGLRFVVKPPQDQWGNNDHWLMVSPTRKGAQLVLPKGDIVAHIAIDAKGEPAVSYWWESRKAKSGTEKGKVTRAVVPIPAGPRSLREGVAINDAASPGDRGRADAAIKQDAGISQDTIQVFRSLRKQIMRALLVDDARAGGDVAADYLVWAQLRMLAGAGRNFHADEVGMRSISTGYEAGVSGALRRIEDALDEQPATKVVADALFELTSQTFVTDPDLADAFLDYRCSAPGLKRLAAAVVAGLALERSLNAPGYGLAAHDAVVQEIVGQLARIKPELRDKRVRSRWSPTEALLGSLPKPALLAIAAEFVDEPTLAAWGKVKSAELIHLVHRVVTGASPSIRAEKRAEAERWVHPLLRFDPPGAREPDDDEAPGTNGTAAELAEAAE